MHIAAFHPLEIDYSAHSQALHYFHPQVSFD
jgi:hypothetical protein